MRAEATGTSFLEVLNQTLRGFALLPLLRAETQRQDLLWLFGETATEFRMVTQGGRYPPEAAADAQGDRTRHTRSMITLVP